MAAFVDESHRNCRDQRSWLWRGDGYVLLPGACSTSAPKPCQTAPVSRPTTGSQSRRKVSAVPSDIQAFSVRACALEGRGGLCTCVLRVPVQVHGACCSAGRCDVILPPLHCSRISLRSSSCECVCLRASGPRRGGALMCISAPLSREF